MSENENDYIHYFYKITNLTNGMYYYGIHSLNKLENENPLTDGYLGSGIDIVKAIKSEGKSNFKKEIIKTFSTREEASDYETQNVTMKEVNDPMCYNKIPGGDGYEKSMIGKIVCRLKEDINKIVVVTKDEYYNNKDKYIPIGHTKFYLEESTRKGHISNIDNSIKYKRTKTNYKSTQKKDENDNFYSRVRWFVNKNTLELKKFIGHNEPEDLYSVWFPIYFFDKINNKFITKEYFIDLYKNTPNLEKISKQTGINKKKLKIIKDFYISTENLDLSKFEKGRGKAKTKAFSGKRYVNNGIDQVIINESEINSYIQKGYKLGKLIILPKQDIINYYTLGNNIKKCSKKFSTSTYKIKEVLGIDNTFETRRYYNSNGESIRLLVNKEYHEKLLSNGWKLGVYKKP